MTGLPDAQLYRLTYLSSARDEVPLSELDAILEVAREKNSRRQVTGLLLYHDMQFFQTLEGPQAEVEQIFNVIKTDRRHGGCVVLESRPVAARCFDRWSMGYKKVGDLNSSQKQDFLDLAGVRGRNAANVPNGDARTRILIDSFLSSFRDLDIPVTGSPSARTA